MTDKFSDNNVLLKKFNDRDRTAFGQVYSMFYSELYYYTSNLYQNSSIEACDIIQDVFVNIWQSPKRKFDRLEGIKAYLFVSIKNSYRNFYVHNKLTNKLNHKLAEDDDLFIVQAVESEIFSIVPSMLNMLPEECAKSFKMFIEGWDIKEIAEVLGKKKSTIYNQRQEAIAILRKQMKNGLIIVFMIQNFAQNGMK